MSIFFSSFSDCLGACEYAWHFMKFNSTENNSNKASILNATQDLSLTVDRQKIGFYQCEVRGKAGKGYSTQTKLDVYWAPRQPEIRWIQVREIIDCNKLLLKMKFALKFSITAHPRTVPNAGCAAFHLTRGIRWHRRRGATWTIHLSFPMVQVRC